MTVLLQSLMVLSQSGNNFYSFRVCPQVDLCPGLQAEGVPPPAAQHPRPHGLGHRPVQDIQRRK